MHANIDNLKCTHGECMLCFEVCPEQAIIEYSENQYYVDTSKCTCPECGSPCVEDCPEEAIEIHEHDWS